MKNYKNEYISDKERVGLIVKAGFATFLVLFLTVVFLLTLFYNPVSLETLRSEHESGLTNQMVLPMSSRMTFSMNAAESRAASSITIEATIKPNTAANKEVDWTVDWVNGSSEWASGKAATDYLSVTPVADGSTIATVACQKAFGEQIAIKVTSRQNAEKSATCIVDYLCRNTLSGVEVTYKDYSESNIIVRGQDEGEILELTLPEVENVYDLLTTNAYEYAIKEYDYGTYTKQDKIISQKIEMKPGKEFCDAYFAQGVQATGNFADYTQWYDVSDLSYSAILGSLCGGYNLIDYASGKLSETGYERFLAACAQTTVFDFTLRITTTCESGAETQYEVLFHISDKTPGLAVEDVAVNTENLVV